MQTIEATFEIVPANAEITTLAKASIEESFTGYFQQARELADKAVDVTDPKQARAFRLSYKSIRVEAEKTRKSLKEQSLREGRAIDGANNILIAFLAPKEEAMDDIEKAAERAEAVRIEALRMERADILDSMDHVSHGVSLGTLTDDQWNEYHLQAKDAFFARRERERKAKEELEAQAKREAEEREAQRMENIRLREEADKAAAALAVERAEQVKRDAAAKAERDAAELKSREEVRKANEAAELARQKAADELAKEQAAKMKLEAEAKALRDAESKRLADEKSAADAKVKSDAAAAKKAASAPDKAKLMEFAAMVRELKLPDVKSGQAETVRLEIETKVASFARWIESQAATL